jgi:hypothetical protein|tara:strand:+ start:2357 stop:2608 length:252 start_codon:yes stop_codon:yes gene_type:complete
MSKLPEWFNGSLYENGDKVRNRFSGEEYELTAEELSMYDFIQGAQIILEMDSGTITPQIIKDLQKGLRWFRENNSEAYMTLLD